MKRYLLLMICVVSVMTVAAQSHSYSDTILVHYEQFDFDAWVAADTIGDRGRTYENRPAFPDLGANTGFGYSDILQYNYTDNPAGVDVVGLSAVIFVGNARTDVPEEHLLLYDALTDDFVLKAQVQWLESDTAGRPSYSWRTRQTVCNYPSTEGWRTSGGGRSVRQFDYYFDKPITVYDSFYVGGTDHSVFPFVFPEQSSSLTISNAGYATFWPTVNRGSNCYQISLWKIYNYDVYGNYVPAGYPAYQWVWRWTAQFMMVLPIIKVVDTSFANAPECPRVSGLFMRGNNTDTVTLQWADDSLHNEFEVSYGDVNMEPGEGTVVTVRDHKWQFSDRAYNDSLLAVYVRTVCREYDTLRWSGWSSPARIRLHFEDSTQGVGIEVPDETSDLSRFVRLMPNPASESVVVTSSYGMEKVEVFDVMGRKVYDQPAEGTVTEFHVSSWAKGSYAVLVHTPAGTAVKRLMVQ